MKFNKIKAALGAIGMGVALSAVPVSAAVTLYSPVTLLHDDSIEFVVDTNSNGLIDVGDRLVAIGQFGNSQGVLAGQGPSGFAGAELTFISDITVTAFVGGRLIFGASGAAGVLGALPAGTTGVVYHDNTPDLPNVINANCGTRAVCLANAGLGLGDGSTIFMRIGFYGDADNFWVSDPVPGAGISIASVQNGLASTSFGSFNFGQNVVGLDVKENQACAPFCAGGGNGQVQIFGNGQILGGQGLIPAQFTARDKLDAQFSPIPEPTTLALLGLGLLGLGLRKRNA